MLFESILGSCPLLLLVAKSVVPQGRRGKSNNSERKMDILTDFATSNRREVLSLLDLTPLACEKSIWKRSSKP
jgi:hypothetical protein